MKLRNKKTGKVIKLDIHWIDGKNYESLAEVNSEWEDYEEDKRFWYIDVDGEIMLKEMAWFNQAQDNIGNRFETKEEAEKAVERLRARKRLKDKGFHWLWYNSTPAGNSAEFYINDWDKEATRDITLLFGGEE